jgi:hypothetical protein
MSNTRAKKKKAPVGSAAVIERPKPKKAAPKRKRRRGPTNEQLRELMKSNKPPQSWFEEDHQGLY